MAYTYDKKLKMSFYFVMKIFIHQTEILQRKKKT